jgi:hypothetical protein
MEDFNFVMFQGQQEGMLNLSYTNPNRPFATCALVG